MILLLALACAPAPDDSGTGPRICNGHADLCDRPLDAVAFPMTHNAMSNAEDGWLAPNQNRSIDRQLADGVRGFMLDVHPLDDEAFLCHGSCDLGSERLADGMGRFRRFLDENPDEVLVFVLQSDVDPGWIAAAFDQAGMTDRARVQAPGDPWPSLAALLDGGTPLVVFSQDEGGDVPWILAGYRDFMWDTPYAATTPEDLSCAPLRGSTDHSLFLVNHFLTAPIALPELAEQVNPDPFLSERIDACAQQAGQAVNFVAVDFYDIGDLLPAIARLNQTGQTRP